MNNDLLPSPTQESFLLLATGAIVGTMVTILLTVIYLSTRSVALLHAEDNRRRLPKKIILVRHGESEANADHIKWKTIPDNLLGLTQKGKEEAASVGKRVEAILSRDRCHRVHLVVSPFERTLQTAAAMRSAFEHRIVRTDIESRIREQEMGNIQGDDFEQFRQEQKKVGRFWYRFPTGESGTDVLDRVKSFWFESVLTVNTRVGFEPVDALVIVTHGLTMRFILMQLFNWSPTTFHSVWNADNVALYLLRKDLDKPGPSPFILDRENGDVPRSSIDVMVSLKSTGEKKVLKLEDYLSIPPPRTTRIGLVKYLLERQYPSEIKARDIASILFMPFVDTGGVVKGRSTSGIAPSSRSSSTVSEVEVDTRLCSAMSSSQGKTSNSTDYSERQVGETVAIVDKEGLESGKNDGKESVNEENEDSEATDADTSCHIRFAKQEESTRESYLHITELTDQNES